MSINLAWPRALLRLLGFVIISSLSFALLVVAAIVLLAAPVARQRFRQAVFRFLARAITKLIGMRTTTVGVPPDGRFVLVVNHQSYLDIIVLAAQMRGVFVAKSEVAGWPFLGPMVRSMNTIFIDRTRRSDLLRVRGEIGAALTRGEGVIVFAEGTSSDGHDVLPLRPSLLGVAGEHGLPLHYARISYATLPGAAPASHALCWWGDMTFFGHLMGVLGLTGFKALVHFATTTVSGPDRKALARQLRDAIRSLSVVSPN